MYELTEILPAASGERLLLRLISDSGEAVTVNISCKTYSELALKKGELSDSAVNKLLTEADFEKAVIKGMNILGFGANSAQTLKIKLVQKGFSPSTAEKAVRYLKSRGYIDEKKDAIRLCESMLKKNTDKNASFRRSAPRATARKRLTSPKKPSRMWILPRIAPS